MYKLTQKTTVVEGKEYRVYGIRYSDAIFVEDVTTDRARIEGLIADCNKYSLDPIHLMNVIEDFLAE